MIIIPFIDAHLDGFELQDVQAWLHPLLQNEDYRRALTLYGPAHSAIVDGTVVACAGLTHFTPGRAQGWALIGSGAQKHLLGITKAVKAFFDGVNVRRIETPVRTDFVEGHRWVRILGFTREGTMRNFGEDGQDYDLYARVNNG